MPIPTLPEASILILSVALVAKIVLPASAFQIYRLSVLSALADCIRLPLPVAVPVLSVVNLNSEIVASWTCSVVALVEYITGVVPIPTLPAGVMNILLELFALIAKLLLLAEPTNPVPNDEPRTTFSLPVGSRILMKASLPLPSNLAASLFPPATWKGTAGLVVPIPTLPVVPSTTNLYPLLEPLMLYSPKAPVSSVIPVAPLAAETNLHSCPPVPVASMLICEPVA